MESLEELRATIRDLDERILRLVSERMRAAAQIGKVKKAQRVPLRDWQVERTVLQGAEETAQAIGLSPTLTRNVMQLLIAESRARQERETYSNYSGATENILVIGGRGKMGRWLVDFLANQGHRVTVYDTAEAVGVTTSPSFEEALRDTTCAVISTPLDVVPGTIDRLAAAKYPGLAFDIASLKGHLQNCIVRAVEGGLDFTSIHPMFGPGTQILSDQVICVCDCGRPSATARVGGFFADTAVTLVELSLDDHDRIVSYVLGLSHLINILFARVLMHCGGTLADLNRVGSTTFHAQLATSMRIMQENPELYYSIQRLNPYTPRLYEAVTREWQALTKTVSDGDKGSFVEMMEAGLGWLEGR